MFLEDIFSDASTVGTSADGAEQNKLVCTFVCWCVFTRNDIFVIAEFYWDETGVTCTKAIFVVGMIPT